MLLQQSEWRVRASVQAFGFITLLVLALCLALAQSPAARAETGVCAAAADRAAVATGVPRDWLHAIALAESGRNHGEGRAAWPWTVNDAGRGLWFTTERQAVAYVKRRIAQGERLIDIGCFQVNWHWHGKAFASIAAAFQPDANALYAAEFLKALYAKTGDWRTAAGRYHSARDKHSVPYRNRVARIRARLTLPDAATAREFRAHAGAIALVMLAEAKPLLRPAANPLLPVSQ